MGFGYYLEAHHNWNGYAAILCVATLFGLIDISLFTFVHHRRPRMLLRRQPVFPEFLRRLREGPFRRLILVYILWSTTNCIVGPVYYYFMRDCVHMGISSIATCDTLSLIAFTIFSLLWGKFSDEHGHRNSLVMCLLIHMLSMVPVFFAGPGDTALVFLSITVGCIGFCGINLFMLPMLINATRGRGGGRAVSMAAFSTVLSLTAFLSFTISDRYLYGWLGGLLHADPHSTPVYFTVFAATLVLRGLAAVVAWSLPAGEAERSPEIIIEQFVTTNPLRAALSLLLFATGRQEWEGAEGDSRSIQRRSERLPVQK